MNCQLLLGMVLVGGMYLAMFGIGELLNRRGLVPSGVTRKIDHVGAGGIALVLPLVFDTPWPVIGLSTGFLMFLLVTKHVGQLDSVHGIRRRTAGAFLYPVAISAAFVVSSDRYPEYAVAILALALADALGGLAGEHWGRRPYLAWGQVKSVEGTLTALVVTAVVSTGILMAAGGAPIDALRAGIFTGLVVALVEGALPWGLDNLAVPLAALAALAASASWSTAAALLAAALLGISLAVVGPRIVAITAGASPASHRDAR